MESVENNCLVYKQVGCHLCVCGNSSTAISKAALAQLLRHCMSLLTSAPNERRQQRESDPCFRDWYCHYVLLDGADGKLVFSFRASSWSLSV